MAYSNTNRDKAQSDTTFGPKRALIAIVLVVISASSLFNIYQKRETLKEARDRNNELKSKINKLTKENKAFELQIAEATQSAYMDRKAREYLGMGTTNDSWIVIPKDDENREIIDEVNTVDEKPIIVQWLELFTM